MSDDPDSLGDHRARSRNHSVSHAGGNLRIFDLPEENALVERSASQELPLPKDFEQLVEGRNPDELENKLVLDNDPDEFLEEISNYERAGYTHVYVHQIGPDQEGFLNFAESELLPRF